MSGWNSPPRRRTYEIGQCSRMVLAVALEIVARDLFYRDQRQGSYGWHDPSDPDCQETAHRILFGAQTGVQREMRDEALLYAHGCIKVLKEQFGVEEQGVRLPPQYKRKERT